MHKKTIINQSSRQEHFFHLSQIITPNFDGFYPAQYTLKFEPRLTLNNIIQQIDSADQEIYRPGTAISDASNLCTAVGGDQNKELRGKTSIMRGEGNKIY